MTNSTIPTGWKKVKFEDISVLVTKGSSPKWQGFEYQNEGMFFVTSENVRCGYLNSAKPKFLPLEFHKKLKKSQLRDKDILINIVGASIGRSCIYRMEYEYANINQAVCLVRLKNDILHYFVLQYLQNPKTIERLLDSRAGSGRPNLSLNDIRNFSLTLPPLPEQNRIVTVLETWDKAIEQLTQKIKVKKSIKKGLMQKLLTGQIRLPGFSEPWSTVELATIGDTRTSSVDKKTVEGEQEVSLLNYMDVYKRDHISNNDTLQRVTVKRQQLTSSNLKQGDILFTPSSETPDDIGHSAVVIEDLENVVFSYHLMRFRPQKSNLHYRFSAYCFKTNEFYLELWKKAQGATRFTLSKEALEKSKITIPTSKDEQLAIADFLETSDKAIEMFERKLSLLEDQKKYLLNNLITGKIRTPEFIN
ncbi:restriction endonuclease subunit S [bacterium]|nr:restriction endonuclease subunit S [bacterium]